MKERYFSLKSIQDPEEQVGIVIKATPELTLEDKTGFLSLIKERNKKNKGYRNYGANTNVDLFGEENEGEKDIMKLRVFLDAHVEIYKQPDYGMKIEEIPENIASQTVDRVNRIREHKLSSVCKTAYPGNLGNVPSEYL